MVVAVKNSAMSEACESISAAVKSAVVTQEHVKVEVRLTVDPLTVTSFWRIFETDARYTPLLTDAPRTIKELSGWPNPTVVRVYVPGERGSYVRV